MRSFKQNKRCGKTRKKLLFLPLTSDYVLISCHSLYEAVRNAIFDPDLKIRFLIFLLTGKNSQNIHFFADNPQF